MNVDLMDVRNQAENIFTDVLCDNSSLTDLKAVLLHSNLHLNKEFPIQVVAGEVNKALNGLKGRNHFLNVCLDLFLGPILQFRGSYRYLIAPTVASNLHRVHSALNQRIVRERSGHRHLDDVKCHFHWDQREPSHQSPLPFPPEHHASLFRQSAQRRFRKGRNLSSEIETDLMRCRHGNNTIYNDVAV